MYNIGDYVIHKKEVCKIVDIKNKYMKNKDYYVLESVSDNSLKLKVPVDSKYIRETITKDEVNNIINNMMNIEYLDVDDKNIESIYKDLLNNPTHENLIKIIKTTYLRNKNRIDAKRKISDKDKNYFEQAEKYLYTEFSVVLGKSFEETKQYVINEVEKLKINE
ncbi:MAG: CarD family transcriptional regulator [Bacilli bacterium]|nr:CarD family transcriptional regulator [Bacilli bacterium]